MARHGRSKIPGTRSKPKLESRLKMVPVEGMEPGDLGEEDAGHVLVVTQFGLAMIVAGLRSIQYESPEVSDLLKTLEKALREGMEERIKV